MVLSCEFQTAGLQKSFILGFASMISSDDGESVTELCDMR